MSDVTAVENLVQKHQALKTEIGKVIIGQEKVIEQILLSIYTGGHSLLVGVPGLAKTLMVNTIAKTLGLDFKRIQFTPDLMPSDILGSEVLDQNRNFKFKQLKLDEPYFVLATQNPIEQEGTYPLPEAQLDRFMFAIELTYPSLEEEIQVVKVTTNDETATVNTLFSSDEILAVQHLIRRIPVPDNVVRYAVELVTKTRPGIQGSLDFVNNFIDWGAGPRASQNLVLGAKANAAISGKFSPDIEDVQAVAPGILRHRILKNYKAEAEGITEEKIIRELL